MMQSPSITPARTKVWRHVAAEHAANRPFPSPADIAAATGYKNKSSVVHMLHVLCSDGLVLRQYSRNPGGGRALYDWQVSPLGEFLIKHPEAASPPVSEASTRKLPKPRRTGSPKRIPHKPTAAHKKPSRQQWRETERRREHKDQATA